MVSPWCVMNSIASSKVWPRVIGVEESEFVISFWKLFCDWFFYTKDRVFTKKVFSLSRREESTKNKLFACLIDCLLVCPHIIDWSKMFFWPRGRGRTCFFDPAVLVEDVSLTPGSWSKMFFWPRGLSRRCFFDPGVLVEDVSLTPGSGSKIFFDPGVLVENVSLTPESWSKMFLWPRSLGRRCFFDPGVLVEEVFLTPGSGSKIFFDPGVLVENVSLTPDPNQ
jgi:hypothetical protein